MFFFFIDSLYGTCYDRGHSEGIAREYGKMKCPGCDFDNTPESAYCGKCGKRLSPSPEAIDSTVLYTFPLLDLEVGTLFAGRYQVIEELGSGGMGKVYKVMDKEVKEKIAIKVLKPEISFDERIIERFRNELKLARKISHPNVCRMYDLLKEKGLYFITMEYVSGEDLKSTIARVGLLSVGKALSIAEQVCKGLSEAHKLGVVHRDLKPHNIIIDRHGDARIMDFGIAHTLMTKGLTETGVMIGTPEYMSPEQAVGEVTDPRSDIYSLGVILFELLTGTLPFKGDTAVGVALKQKTELPPNPKSLNPQIPDEVNKLILRCLEKDKNNRFQSATLLLEEISRIQRGFPTTEKLIPEIPPTTSGGKTKKWAFPLVKPLVLVIVLLAAAAGYLLFDRILKVGPGQHPKKATEKIADTRILERARSFDLSSGVSEMKDVFFGTSEIKDIPYRKIESTDVTPGNRGTMDISSEPPGALVYLNESKKGQQTPLKIPVPAGTYRIRIDHPNFLEETGELRVETGKISQKKFVLKPAYIIDILSDPLGASVFINGEPRGQTPQLKLKMAKQTCLLKLEKLGYEVHSEELLLNLGLNLPKKIALKKLLVKISIQTNPSKAKISIDEKLSGTSPWTQTIETGAHHLKIEKEGYETEEKKIEFYQDFNIELPLTPIEYGTIEVSSYPRATVYLDGNPVLEKGAPLVLFTGPKKLKVRVGPHKIEFVSSTSNEKLSAVITAETGKTYKAFANFKTGKVENIK
jgi:serine/threonine protein kinase